MVAEMEPGSAEIEKEEQSYISKSKLYLVGTAHFSEESQNDVSKVRMILKTASRKTATE